MSLQTKLISIFTVILVISATNIFANYDYYDEFIFALKNAAKSEGFKISLLSKNDQEHSFKVVLIGLKNSLLEDDAQLIRDIIDATLDYDPNSIISGEWSAIEVGLSLMKENLDELAKINVQNLGKSTNSYWQTFVTGLDRSLNFIALGSFGATVFLTSQPDGIEEKIPSIKIPKFGYPTYDNGKLNECILTVPAHGDYKSHLTTFIPGCVHNFIRETIVDVQKNIALQLEVTNNLYKEELPKPTFSAPWSFYTAATCFAATSAQKMLRWMCPIQEIPKSHSIADEIINLLSEDEEQIIISLVELDHFREVKNKLLGSQFIVQNIK